MKSQLLKSSDPRWMDFITACPDANIFHHPAWMELMSECYGYKPHVLVVLSEHDEVSAGIPFMDVTSPFSRLRRVSLPFSDYCNPLYRDEASRQALTGYLVQMFTNEHIQRIEVRWNLPEREQIHRVTDFVLHTIRLNPDPNVISKNFKRTHWQNIHTAEDRGVKVEIGRELEQVRAFYQLQLETRKRHGVPAQPWKYFELLWQHVISKDLGFVMLAKKDDEIIAGMVYLGWGNTLVAKYAASREDHFNLRPNNLLFWEGICWGCRNGFTRFDMGRTEVENTGLRTFKSRWGAVEETLEYSVLTRNAIHHINGKLTQAMHSIIKKSPLWVCRLSGELLYRYIG